MAATDAQAHNRPIAIATAPGKATTSDHGADHGTTDQSVMPYTCQACAKRKVKCDKTTPVCSSCRRAQLECLYQAPPPRRRKRKLSSDIHEQLARYEHILHQHGLLPQDADTTPPIKETEQEPMFLRFDELDTSRTGKLLAGQGKSRYIDSNIWRNLGDDEMQSMSDDEGDDAGASTFASDPLTGALMGAQQSLLQYHPTHAEAMILWKTHVESVEPICKVLHIPTTSKMVEMVSQQPATASNTDECLLFAVYHFAVFSMTEEDCAKRFGHSRATLLQRYHFATRQALVNASFLKTTEIAVVQTLILFLLPCRFSYDPHTYWILTGVATRIAQRIGLHRDGEKLGLPPFEVQMRRRLFYQLIPLDGIAGQMSGTGITNTPDTWDTQQPLNIDDDQIWPGMTETPKEQKGATEMMFCLARSCVGSSFAKTGRVVRGTGAWQNEVEAIINQAESEVEEKFIRYCDIVNPLHVLTVSLARSAINAMRLRIRLPKVRDQTVSDIERKELFQISEKIMDTDAAVCTHTSLKRFQWHLKSFFVWGSWDTLILVLTSLRRPDLLTRADTDAAWARVDRVFENHGELLASKRALHTAIRRITLKAWDANPPSSSVPEPACIAVLRSLQEVSRAEKKGSDATALGTKSGTVSSTDPIPPNDVDALFDSLSGSQGLDLSNDVDLDTADWMFWDQLIQDYQAQGG